MVRTSLKLAAAPVALALMTSAHGSGTYYGLGTNRSATGVNADGTVVAGTSSGPYWIWKLLPDPTITTTIGGLNLGAVKVSDDGDKISGVTGGFVPPVTVPPFPVTVVNQMAVYDVSDATWTGAGGLGWFSLSINTTETSTGMAMSGDGTTLVGFAHSPNQTNQYAVTSINGAAPTALPWLIPGRDTRAFGCNYDGSVVVGRATNNVGTFQAAVWTNGVGQRLWLEYPKKPVTDAAAVSADGTWVIGPGSANTNTQAWRWSQSTGVLLLGEMIPFSVNGIATGISADGGVIVGHELSGVPAAGPGFIWTTGGGMQDLTTYATDNGVVLPPGVTLQRPLNVSADGRTFVGVASNGHGFVVRIDPPALAKCSGDTNADRKVDISDMTTVITAWGTCANSANCPADINTDLSVNIDDLLAVINSWGDCP